MKRALCLVVGTALLLPGISLAQTSPVKSETVCNDGKDDDGDGLIDCGDADCKGKPECEPDGSPENTDKKCSNWIDDDKDGYTDCDDLDCQGAGVQACKGSWTGPVSTGGGTTNPNNGGEEPLPELGEGQTVEDLIGTGTDKDGERNDVLCADGVDNDNDGKTDCADFGCRFDPNVTVCRGNPGMRFSVVANIQGSYDFITEQPDVLFSKLQLRSFGPMPFIQNSFYLLSIRAEKTPRLTFAMFQIPLGGGHFMNINSGGGGLSNALILSSAKQLLLNPPFYLYSAFEQGNGAAAEVYGPIDQGGIVRYRAYLAGGAGLFSGNVGGRFFSFDNTNFTWGAGAAFGFNILGRYSRWDSQFMYTNVPTSLSINVGAKYDQRAQERYVAVNGAVNFRVWRFAAAAETYYKRELEFESDQIAYNIRVGFLLWPKHLMIGADFGEFVAGDRGKEPENLELELRRQLNELQWRVALHWYFWRNVGVATLLYTDREVEPSSSTQVDPDRERDLRLEIQYRF